MTTSQIKSLGILMDQWITLEYLVNYIGFGSDSGIFVSPVYTPNSISSLLLKIYLLEKLKELEENVIIIQWMLNMMARFTSFN